MRTARARDVPAALLIGADGIHSAVRAQMHPGQPPIHWGGSIMWRGVTWATPDPHRRVVRRARHAQASHRVLSDLAPGSDDRARPDQLDCRGHLGPRRAETQLAAGSARCRIETFLHHFADWTWDWLDVPALIRGGEFAFENPMIDRDPVPTWVDGPVALLGDAAHAMYPTGSNGASQAIVDARVLGAAMCAHGATPAALRRLRRALCGPISRLVLRNRGAGPFGLLNLVDERCGGRFDNIDDVIPPDERNAFMADYKAAAGFAMETLNRAPPTIAPGARVAAAVPASSRSSRSSPADQSTRKMSSSTASGRRLPRPTKTWSTSHRCGPSCTWNVGVVRK